MQPELGISSLSLGSCEHHSLASKLRAAARAGFTAIDLFDTDWEQFKRYYASLHNLPPSTIDGDDTSLQAARAINRLCLANNLRLMCLQPCRDVEGRKDPIDAAERLRRARGTLSVLPALGTTMLLIPSTTLPASQLDSDPNRMAADLAQLADYAASFSPPLQICYEALSWGTHVSTWKAAWDVVRRANRRNLGLCLDSFNTAAREWADPYNLSGVRDPNVGIALSQSLDDLVKTVPADKIFYFQLADGQRMTKPLTPPEDPSVPPLRPWSRSYRLFPLESDRGAYLPVKEFAEAVCRTGYKGPWCLEIFNDSLNDSNTEVPDEHARRGIVSLDKTLRVLGVDRDDNESAPKWQSLLGRPIRATFARFLLVLPVASAFFVWFKTIPSFTVPTRFSFFSFNS